MAATSNSSARRKTAAAIWIAASRRRRRRGSETQVSGRSSRDSQRHQRQRTTGWMSRRWVVTSLCVELLLIRRRHGARRWITIRRIYNSISYHDGELTRLLVNSIADNHSVFKTSWTEQINRSTIRPFSSMTELKTTWCEFYSLVETTRDSSRKPRWRHQQVDYDVWRVCLTQHVSTVNAAA